MKAARYIICIILGLWLNIATAQDINFVKIDMDVKSKTLKEVFQIIEQKTGLHFIYNEELVAAYNNVSINGTGRTISSILNDLLSKTSLWYLEQNNKIIIEKKAIAPTSPAENKTAINRELITGKILEAGTDKPVRNASVYFDGTLNGTSSDSEGNFTLYPKANGAAPIIVSAIGYESETITDLPAGKRALIYLSIKAIDLEAVTISASDGMSRKEKLRLFRREFLGTSSNARNSEIINEDDITLTYYQKTNTLKAFSEKPIIVRNKNLGYTLNFFPKDIIISPTQTLVQGYQFFEDNATPETIEKIARARETTYLGSQIHFIRSLWNDDLQKNRFRIYTDGYPVTFAGIKTIRRTWREIPYDSIVTSRDNQKYIHFNGPVYIDYKGNKSEVGKGASDKDALIARNGYSDPTALLWQGIIGKQRIGDALPLEYKNADIPEPQLNRGINDIIASIDTMRSHIPAEKLYVQLDRPYYSVGDTVWLKAYLFDAAFLRASEKSGIAYVELANDTNKVLLRRMLPLEFGLGSGNIVLNKDDIPEGSYTIRAYTNLMLNFGEDLIFKKNFYVSSGSAQSWLVNSKVSAGEQAVKENLRLNLQFIKLNKESLGLHDMDFRIRDGARVLLRDKVQTDVNGTLDVNFNLPENVDAKNISLVVGDLAKGEEDHKVNIPLVFNRPENTDVQFMPEGGNLVAGLSSIVGVKAISEDGNGVDISGKIYSNNNQEVAAFSCSHKGMGSFEFTPKENESYTAKVQLPTGTIKSFPLPSIKSSGTVLRVVNKPETDSIEVLIAAASGFSPVTTYYLLAQSRGVICYGAIIRFTKTTITRKIAKDVFPSGITRFTLMNAEKQPLNERIVYIGHEDNLNLTFSPVKTSIAKRDSICLDIEVKDKDGNPGQGSFSLAVTDDNQVRTDSLSSNILTSLLLTSDLKGTVEDPGYYLQQTKKCKEDLDILLLTQGWVGYNWNDVFNPIKPVFPPEPEFMVHGRVSNVFNKNLTSTSIRLLSMRPAFLKDTLTNSDGTFQYAGLPLADTVAFFIQARNKNNKSFNTGIEVEEFKPFPFSSTTNRVMPWYVNSDTSLLKYVKTVVQKKEDQIRLSGGNILSEVTITAKKIINGSRNLNGPGESDQALDEKELQKAEKTTLLQLLKDRITGFNEGEFPHPTHHPMQNNEPYRWSYRIGASEIRLVIDGMDVEKFYTGAYFYELPDPLRLKYHKERFEYIKDYLLFFTAEDVKGIEVMYRPKYNSRYNSTELSGSELLANNPTANDFAYIEITTKSGKGPFERRVPGTFTYKPMPFILPKEFYRPRYVASINPALGTDMRSTIFWKPDVITDINGKATVSFYASDNPGTYSIIMEGSDMNGNLGRQTGKITVK